MPTRPASGGDVFLPPANGAHPAAGSGSPGGKILGLDRNTFYIVVIAGAAVVGYLIYRHYKNNSNSAAATPDTSGTGTDTSGAIPTLPVSGDTGGGGQSGIPTAAPPPDQSGLIDSLLGEISSLIAAGAPSTNGSASGPAVTINVTPAAAGPSSQPPATHSVTPTIVTPPPAASAAPVIPDFGGTPTASVPDTYVQGSAGQGSQYNVPDNTPTPVVIPDYAGTPTASISDNYVQGSAGQGSTDAPGVAAAPSVSQSVQKVLASSYGGGKTSGQVKRNNL